MQPQVEMRGLIATWYQKDKPLLNTTLTSEQIWLPGFTFLVLTPTWAYLMSKTELLFQRLLLAKTPWHWKNRWLFLNHHHRNLHNNLNHVSNPRPAEKRDKHQQISKSHDHCFNSTRIRFYFSLLTCQLVQWIMMQSAQCVHSKIKYQPPTVNQLSWKCCRMAWGGRRAVLRHQPNCTVQPIHTSSNEGLCVLHVTDISLGYVMVFDAWAYVSGDSLNK